MPNLQNLYQVLKLSSTLIVENNLNIENYSKTRAVKEGTLVSIADNQVFRQIRLYYNDHRSHEEIFKEVQKYRRSMRSLQREGKYKEAHIINRCISDILFVKDIINVEVIAKKEYSQLAKDGFYANGVHYVRFCCGSGQMRRNTITFINAALYDSIYKNLMCGLDQKVTEMNLAKFHAYFALSFSAVMWVRNPRVCVVKDYEHVLPQQKVDWVCADEQTGKKHIEERVMDLELNCSDGQGLIDPEFAKLWAQDMKLSYIPSSFVVRSVFVKGSLVPFDFKKYAAFNGIDTIRDRWGIGHRVEDIDVILSESQFKMYKYYISWYEYEKYANAAEIQWGVARYNRKYDSENVLANYQYLQCLSLSKTDITELVKPTVDWIKKICTGDELYTMLYMFGCKGESFTYQDLKGSAQSLATKALVRNRDMLQDTYVQKKIYKNLTETINRAKLGKIWIRGNYSFMISDPVAQCQSALGLEPVGLLKSNEVYSRFWVDRGVNYVDLCRSPMIDVHEHNPCSVVWDGEMSYWYQYITSGIIYNTWDSSTFRASDADFDGDIVLSTDNQFFIKGSHKEHNIVSYEKGAAPVQKICLANSIKTDIRGLGTGVGGFSNCGTIMYTMQAIFNKDSQQEQRSELSLRIKLLREIVGQEIDRIKGTAAPELPKEWKKFVKINEDDTDAVKADKYKHNSMVISKKPYFFRYLYPELNQKFKQYEDSYNRVSLNMYGMKFKKLMAKPNKSEEEMNLIRRYQKYSPLITAPCVMNLICKEFENTDFDLKFHKDSQSLLSKFVSVYDFSQEKFEKVRTAYRQYSTKKQIKTLDQMDVSMFMSEDEYEDFCYSISDNIRDTIRLDLESAGMNCSEALYYTNLLAQDYKQFNWDFAWDVWGEDLLDIIPEGKINIPISYENGEEYLGSRYILKQIKDTDIFNDEEDFWDFDSLLKEFRDLSEGENIFEQGAINEEI